MVKEFSSVHWLTWPPPSLPAHSALPWASKWGGGVEKGPAPCTLVPVQSQEQMWAIRDREPEAWKSTNTCF